MITIRLTVSMLLVALGVVWTQSYISTAVKFNVNQIGNAPEASAFLDQLQTLRTQPDFRDVLHITTGKCSQFFHAII